MENKKIAIFIIIICIVSLISSIFYPKINKGSYKVDSSKDADEKDIYGYSPFKGDKISVVKIEGIISDTTSSSIFRENTTSSSALEQIIKLTADKNTKAIVIRINSPGGTVAASQELYKAILKAKSKKPVVITMGDVAASGGYYIASAGDIILANPGTLTGSIGVITSYLNFTELLKKYGVQGITVKAGKYKDIGNATRHLTEEEKKILQALLDNSYKQFINDVAKGREMPVEKVAKIAEGLIYTGEQAYKIGLVDKLGDYYDAIKKAQELAKKRFPELQKKYGKKDIPLDETWKNESIIDSLIGISKPKNISIFSESINGGKLYTYSKFQPLWLLE